MQSFGAQTQRKTDSSLILRLKTGQYQENSLFNTTVKREQPGESNKDPSIDKNWTAVLIKPDIKALTVQNWQQSKNGEAQRTERRGDEGGEEGGGTEGGEKLMRF